LNAAFNESTAIYTDENLTIPAINGFYSSGGIVRELVDNVLLPQQTCAPCGVEVSLCFGISTLDVCCYCDETCTTPYNLYLVSNPNAFAVNVSFYDENGILNTNSLPASAIDATYCSIGSPFSDEVISVVYDSCDCLA
jgi:hypothetical protein